MNIPARYCTGYLGDIGVPPDPAAMDYGAGSRPVSAAGGTPLTRATNVPRIGRIVTARGRDASDAAISNSFGHTTLARFKVWTDEIGA